MKRVIQPLIRINTRIKRDQHAFIKKESARSGKTEGELFREIVQFYIENII